MRFRAVLRQTRSSRRGLSIARPVPHHAKLCGQNDQTVSQKVSSQALALDEQAWSRAMVRT